MPRLVRNAFSRLRVVHPRAIGRGLPPEAFHRRTDQLGARESVHVAGVAVRVDHHLFLRIDDEDCVVRVLEERPVLALAAAQLVVGGLALQDAAQLGADQGDDVEKARLRTRIAVGEELEHREDALPHEDREGEDRARSRRGLRDLAGGREAFPERAALREDAMGERPVGGVAPRLRQRAVPGQPLRIVEVPEGARDRRAKRIVDGGRLVRDLGDRLQQPYARCGQLLRCRTGWQPAGRFAHTGAVTDA